MRSTKLRLVQVLVAAVIGVLFSGAIGVVEHFWGSSTNRLGILERMLPAPSAYPDVSTDELTRRIAALHGALNENGNPAVSSSLRIDGCQLVRWNVVQHACDDPGRSFWLREWTYDLRLLQTSPPSVAIRPMSYQGITGDVVTFSVNETAARRIEAASRRWFDYVRGLTRVAPGDGSDLPGRMERLREFARTELDDRLWERFAETTRYCAWGDVTGPPRSFYGEVRLTAAPGRGGELAELLHAYKVARCPFDPGLLDQ